jgi:hypothetical protein
MSFRPFGGNQSGPLRRREHNQCSESDDDERIVVSASKLKLNYDFSDPSKVSKSALGLSNLQLPWGAQANTPYAPLALISWDVNAHLWEPGGIPLFAFNDSYSLTETLSKVHGNHTLKFGGLIEKAGKFQNLQGTPEGQIEYEGGGNSHGGGSAVFTSGNAFANLYSGIINGIDQTTNVPNGQFKFWNFEGYVQDSWKFRPNVTLELGARLSYYTNNAEQTGLGVAFSTTAYKRGQGAFLGNDPNKPNGILTEKSGALPKGIYEKNVPLQIAPRVNVAWDLFKDGTTVIRGGGGLFYNRVQGNYQYGVLTAPPNLLTAHADSWGNGQQPISLNNLSQYNPITNPSSLVRRTCTRRDPTKDGNQLPGFNCQRVGGQTIAVAKRARLPMSAPSADGSRRATPLTSYFKTSGMVGMRIRQPATSSRVEAQIQTSLILSCCRSRIGVRSSTTSTSACRTTIRCS